MSDAQPLLIHWANCTQCNYETAVHGRVKCPNCECGMTKVALAGAIADTRNDTDE